MRQVLIREPLHFRVHIAAKSLISYAVLPNQISTFSFNTTDL